LRIAICLFNEEHDHRSTFNERIRHSFCRNGCAHLCRYVTGYARFRRSHCSTTKLFPYVLERQHAAIVDIRKRTPCTLSSSSSVVYVFVYCFCCDWRGRFVAGQTEVPTRVHLASHLLRHCYLYEYTVKMKFTKSVKLFGVIVEK